ncbi:uncharacterized protein LOC124644520 [Helicoverpa zea]|uniref:uncharacterized protein LOC124644520 n=1 Tax=Helicoverpa zea TaxID=7113 RepID=UPI001F5AD8C9|nr:uncharacterized protein LOC124644520 [Helicoverpa zea]
MDWNRDGSKSAEFDKHKSWYKVDIDGDYITKNTKSKNTPKKNINKTKNRSKEKPRRLAKPVISEQKAVVLVKDMKIVKTFEEKPESLSKTHALMFRLGVHLCFSLVMLLTAYYGFSYVMPSQVISSNISSIEGSLPSARDLRLNPGFFQEEEIDIYSVKFFPSLCPQNWHRPRIATKIPVQTPNLNLNITYILHHCLLNPFLIKTSKYEKSK